MKLKLSCLLFIFFLATTIAIAEENGKTAPSSTLEVIEGSIAIDIEDHQPVGASSKFYSDIGKLWCYTRVQGSTGDDSIVHKWYYKDDLLMAIPLKLRSSPYRTYSSKNIPAENKGEWRVEVVDESGNILKTLKFTIE